jgi:hypothetical protein
MNPQANVIYPSAAPLKFSMCYCPPPIQVEFSFNNRVEFSQQNIDDIMGGFADLIRRDGKFMAKFSGVKRLNIQIIKNFHFDEDRAMSAKAVEHINCKFIKEEDYANANTQHVYFTRSRKSITQISQLAYERFEF